MLFHSTKKIDYKFRRCKKLHMNKLENTVICSVITPNSSSDRRSLVPKTASPSFHTVFNKKMYEYTIA